MELTPDAVLARSADSVGLGGDGKAREFVELLTPSCLDRQKRKVPEFRCFRKAEDEGSRRCGSPVCSRHQSAVDAAPLSVQGRVEAEVAGTGTGVRSAGVSCVAVGRAGMPVGPRFGGARSESWMGFAWAKCFREDPGDAGPAISGRFSQRPMPVPAEALSFVGVSPKEWLLRGVLV
jgi:hypothetical protein